MVTERCDRCGRDRWHTGLTHPGLCMTPGGTDCTLAEAHYQRGRRAGLREGVEIARDRAVARMVPKGDV